MFDLDLGKLILFGFVALLVVGPKDMPIALRTLARVFAQLRSLRAQVRKSAEALMADADLGTVDRQVREAGETFRNSIALNPATVMRASLPCATPSLEGPSVAEEAMPYASPEMRAYLAPVSEMAGPAASGSPLPTGASS